MLTHPQTHTLRNARFGLCDTCVSFAYNANAQIDMTPLLINMHTKVFDVAQLVCNRLKKGLQYSHAQATPISPQPPTAPSGSGAAEAGLPSLGSLRPPSAHGSRRRQPKLSDPQSKATKHHDVWEGLLGCPTAPLVRLGSIIGRLGTQFGNLLENACWYLKDMLAASCGMKTRPSPTLGLQSMSPHQQQSPKPPPPH